MTGSSTPRISKTQHRGYDSRRTKSRRSAQHCALSVEQVEAGTKLYDQFCAAENEMTFTEFSRALITQRILSKAEIDRILKPQDAKPTGILVGMISEKALEKQQALLRLVAQRLDIDLQKAKVTQAQDALNTFRKKPEETFGALIKAFVDADVVSVGDLRSKHRIPQSSWQVARDGKPVTDISSEIRDAFIRAVVVAYDLKDTSPPAKAEILGARGITVKPMENPAHSLA